jgi:uncharacterized protein (DUF2225 family)
VAKKITKKLDLKKELEKINKGYDISVRKLKKGLSIIGNDPKYINSFYIDCETKSELTILHGVSFGQINEKSKQVLELILKKLAKGKTKIVYYSLAHHEKKMHELVVDMGFTCQEVGNPNHGKNIFYLFSKEI